MEGGAIGIMVNTLCGGRGDPDSGEGAAAAVLKYVYWKSEREYLL
jgi:hypothetical protein